MPHAIEQKIAALRSQLWRVLVVSGVARFAAALLAIGLGLALFDYGLHLESRTARIVNSLAAWALISLAAVRFIAPLFRARLRDVALARRIEQRYPELHESLSASVEFLPQSADDPLAGSAALRRAVIADTESKLDSVDLKKLVDRQPMFLSVGLAAIAASLVTIAIAINPLAARVAAARLINPIGNNAWPQENWLAVETPVHRIARGSTFAVSIIDREGRPLPVAATIFYRAIGDANNEGTAESLERGDGARFRARREMVTQSFEYRVTGGDDASMSWQKVEVVDPPAVALIEVELIAPEYTKWKNESPSAFFEALEGDEARIHATANRPLRAAQVRLESGERIPAAISSDGLTITIPASNEQKFVVRRGGAYWLELTDREGLAASNEAPYQIRFHNDAAPTAVIEAPSADIWVTPTANLHLRVTAKDDLSLARIDLVTRVDRESVEGTEQRLPLMEEAAPPKPRANVFAGESDEQSIEREIAVADFQAEEGDNLLLLVEAADLKPQVSRSAARTLRVVSPADMLARISASYAALVSDVAKLADRQREALTGVKGLEIQIRETTAVGRADLDQLRGLELAQRQVVAGLAEANDSAARRAAALLQEVENNQLAQTGGELSHDLRRLEETAQRLSTNEGASIAAELTSASKEAQANIESVKNTTDGERARAALARAAQGQEAMVEALSALVASLKESEKRQLLYADVERILTEQTKTRDATAETGKRTLGVDISELNPQQRADQSKVATRQAELQRRYDDVARRLEEASTAEAGAEGAIAIGAAFDLTRDRAVGETMRGATNEIERNQMGQAVQSQGRAISDLKELLDVLAQRRSQSLARLVKKLREAEAELNALVEKQGFLKKSLERAAKLENEAQKRELEKLTREQDALARAAKRIERQLQRLTAKAAQEFVAQSRGKMEAGGNQGRAGDAAGAVEGAAKAEDDLAKAAEELTNARKRAEADLATQLAERIEGLIRPLAQRHQKISDDTKALDGNRSSDSPAPRIAAAIGELARDQRFVREETGALAENLTESIVFRASLRRAGEAMQGAEENLAKTETGAATQDLQSEANERFSQLLAALTAAKKKPPDSQDPPKPKPDNGGGKPKEPGAPTINPKMVAELKLLKVMQEALNARTQKLARELGNGVELDGDAQFRVRRLSDEQREIADLLLDLTKSAPDADALPAAEKGKEGEQEAL